MDVRVKWSGGSRIINAASENQGVLSLHRDRRCLIDAEGPPEQWRDISLEGLENVGEELGLWCDGELFICLGAWN